MMKKSTDPIILASALALLALMAALLAYMFPSVEEITGVASTTPKGNAVVVIKPEDVQGSLAVWTAPVLFTEPHKHHRLFHSDEYLFYPSEYPNGNFVKKVDDETRTPSGIPLKWYRKYSLDFTDPNIDREDPDNDGFSTIVEFRNDPVGTRLKAVDCDGTKSTDPLEAKSHPEYLSRLRLQKFDQRPFHIKFTGYQQLNGVYVFQLHLDDVPSYNQPPLKKTGDELGFEGYVVGRFDKQFTTKVDPNTHIPVETDVSTLELDKPEIGLKIIVPFRQSINSPESTADFIMLMPSEVDKVIKISRGKIFSIPLLTGVSFRVIDIAESGAKLRDTKTNQEYIIPKLEQGEWDEVPQARATATPR